MSGGSSESETSDEIVTPIRSRPSSTASTATGCGTNRMRPRRSSPWTMRAIIGRALAQPGQQLGARGDRAVDLAAVDVAVRDPVRPAVAVLVEDLAQRH